MHTLIYKIVPRDLWQKAEADGIFTGAAIDLKDGYIHFSTDAQVRETARLHFAGVEGLLLVAVPVSALGDRLKFEPSRGGDLFPHLYGELPVSAIAWQKPLPLGPEGHHIFPELSA
ncbi:MAG: DUF952 domain-containing protein [Rhizobiaceae bacterium]|nr:DUF952 domain-containing protein [Rhizobiaceae bacterium]